MPSNENRRNEPGAFRRELDSHVDPSPFENPMVVAEVPLAGFNDLMFPRRCVTCDCEMANSTELSICTNCQIKLSRGTHPACFRCAATRTTPSNTDDDCHKCRGVKFSFECAYSIGDYMGELREVAIRMKHPGQETLTIQMGHWLGYLLNEQIRHWNIDLIVAMPSHWTRHFSRGANVSALLCDGLSKIAATEFQTRLMGQTRPTRKQGTLTRTQRLGNVKGAFKIRSGYSVENRSVLIVDDVMSSGASLNEAAKTLSNGGARKVCVAVVARGVGTF